MCFTRKKMIQLYYLVYQIITITNLKLKNTPLSKKNLLTSLINFNFFVKSLSPGKWWFAVWVVTVIFKLPINNVHCYVYFVTVQFVICY